MSSAVGSAWLQHFTAGLMRPREPRAFRLQRFGSASIKTQRRYILFMPSSIATDTRPTCASKHLLAHHCRGTVALLGAEASSASDSESLPRPPPHPRPVGGQLLLETLSPDLVSFSVIPARLACQFSSRRPNCMVSPSDSLCPIVTGEKED